MREVDQLYDVSTWDQPQKQNFLYSLIYPLERK